MTLDGFILLTIYFSRILDKRRLKFALCANFALMGQFFALVTVVIRGSIDFEINELNARRHSRKWRSPRWILIAAIYFNEVRIVRNFQLRLLDFYKAIL